MNQVIGMLLGISLAVLVVLSLVGLLALLAVIFMKGDKHEKDD